ncbi:MAG: SPOR domain-containing protein [Gemmatimonadetes bacterium]|nr:SPOR domain-containing protein [Gemmatimonadota bacterium]
MRRVAILALALLAGCATVPEERPDRQAAEDRTDDPEFVAAREAARPEFETQADALAAGVYERFVHPDSVRPMHDPPEARPGPRDPLPILDGGGEDPSTEEILGTLPGGPWYDRTEAPRPDRDAPAPDGPRMEPLGARDAPLGGDVPEGPWTLQLGAYNSETGALVRIRQLEREFPDVPRWYTEAAGLWRVYLGRWADRDGADRARRAVALRGYTDAWVTRAP